MIQPVDEPRPERRSPYAVPLAELVGQAQVPADEQVEEQPTAPVGPSDWDERRRQAELAGGA